MATSPTDIANIALGHLGSPLILDIDDSSNKAARSLKAAFVDAAKKVGYMHDWNCLRSRQELVQTGNTPPGGYEFEYLLPAQCLRVITINDDDQRSDNDNWDVEGRLLLTDADSVILKFTKYIPQVTKWSPGYVEAVALELAGRTAVAITQSKGKSVEMKQQFQLELAAFKKMDSAERKRKVIDSTKNSSYIRSRRISTAG